MRHSRTTTSARSRRNKNSPGISRVIIIGTISFFLIKTDAVNAQTNSHKPPQPTVLKSSDALTNPTLVNIVRLVRTHLASTRPISPSALFEGGLQGLANAYPDTLELLNPQVANPDTDRGVLFRLGQQTYQVGRISDFRSFLAQTNMLLRITTLKSKQPNNEVMVNFINGMLAPYDRHGRLLIPDEYNKLRMGTDGQFSGVGLVLDDARFLSEIRETVPNSSAAIAGVQSGDVLLKVNATTTVFLGGEDLAKEFQSTRHGQTRIAVWRPSSGQIHEATLSRSTISTPTATRIPLPDYPDILYTRISSFARNTTEELANLVDEAQRATPAPRGMILDLRDNPGGLLDEAVELADLFLTNQDIVEVRARTVTETERARRDGDEVLLPLTVLINGNSASAAEIVAGALRDTGRALVVGERSYGKGSVQSVFEVGRGYALKITVAHHFTPRRTCIQGVGITPHLQVHLAEQKTDGLWIHSTNEHESRDDYPTTGHEPAPLYETWVRFQQNIPPQLQQLSILDLNYPSFAPGVTDWSPRNDPLALVAIESVIQLADAGGSVTRLIERTQSLRTLHLSQALPATDIGPYGLRGLEPDGVTVWMKSPEFPTVLNTFLSLQSETGPVQLQLLHRAQPRGRTRVVNHPIWTPPIIVGQPQISTEQGPCARYPAVQNCQRFHLSFSLDSTGQDLRLRLLPLVNPNVVLSHTELPLLASKTSPSTTRFAIEVSDNVNGSAFDGIIAAAITTNSENVLYRLVIGEILNGGLIVPAVFRLSASE